MTATSASSNVPVETPVALETGCSVDWRLPSRSPAADGALADFIGVKLTTAGATVVAFPAGLETARLGADCKSLSLRLSSAVVPLLTGTLGYEKEEMRDPPLVMLTESVNLPVLVPNTVTWYERETFWTAAYSTPLKDRNVPCETFSPTPPLLNPIEVPEDVSVTVMFALECSSNSV
jgi:hypothetical protein